MLRNYLEEKKLKKLERVKSDRLIFYTLASDMITETVVNQHNTLGTWEVKRVEILYALLDEFVDMINSNERCKQMEEALA